jgi:formate dehydrogenase iron-sulfur subunit
MAVGILTDITRCVGCRACVYACKEINDLPREGDAHVLNSCTWTVVEERAGLNVRRQCMHCLDPACVSVCPVGALQKRPEGPVVYDETRCMGCRYCMVACPYRVPKYEWESPLPRVQKCIMCFDRRVSQGRQPACTEACPAQATMFGEREDLIREARARIRRHPDRYADHIYGLEEAGGTSVLYLSSLPFDRLGFPMKLEKEPYPRLIWNILHTIPNVVVTGGVLMLGLWWVINRRNEVAAVSDPPPDDGSDSTMAQHERPTSGASEGQNQEQGS